jgi:hypothetical protein
VCGTPCEATHYNTEICAGCLPKIAKMHADAVASVGGSPGWAIVTSTARDDDAKRFLLSDAGCPTDGSGFIVDDGGFESDEDAGEFVVSNAGTDQ